MALKDKVLNQILEDMDLWENGSFAFFEEYNKWTDHYRMRPKIKRSTRSFTNTSSAEITRAVETLATVIYRMLRSQSPNFKFNSRHPDFGKADLLAPQAMIEFNELNAQLPRRELAFIRSAVLYGTGVFNLPWSRNLMFGFEGPDFRPVSLLNFAFDPSVSDIGDSNFKAATQYVTDAGLRALFRANANTWDKKAVRDALETSSKDGLAKFFIDSRLTASGYDQVIHERKNEVITWYGMPDDFDGKMFKAVLLNRQHIAYLEENPFTEVDGMAPFDEVQYIEVEQEGLGHGIGSIGSRLKQDIDANRNRYGDMITFGSMNMMEVPKSSGLDHITIKPGGILKPLQGGQIQPLKPNLEALNPALKLEEIYKDDFRVSTAALTNLQADITKATATASSIAQSEAIRRVSVIAEIWAEPLIRRRVLRWHARNVAFASGEMWLGVTGEDKPVLVTPERLNIPLDVTTSIVTDKNFTPGRLEQLNFAMQTLTAAMGKGLDVDMKAEFKALAQETLHTLGIRLKLDGAPVLEQAGNRMEGLLSGRNDMVRQIQESGLTPEIARSVNLAQALGG